MFSSQTGVKDHSTAFLQGRWMAFPWTYSLLDLLNPVKMLSEGEETEEFWNVLLP